MSSNEKSFLRSYDNVPDLKIKVFKRKIRIYCVISLILFLILVVISVISFLCWFGVIAIQSSTVFLNPIFDVKCGFIEGKINKDAIEFLGIPYAHPPVGRRRFFHAQEIFEKPSCHGLFPNGDSKRPYQAFKYKSVCVQYDKFSQHLIGDENCLYLNIFMPSTKFAKKLPIVFVISGVFFSYGSGNMPGLVILPEVVKSTNAIHVTCNYRLGPMNSIINPQNNETNHGLSDLLMALIWVHKNMGFFGGDTSNVILFGVGSGSTMALALYNSNKAINLFSKLWISNPVTQITTGIEEALINQKKNFIEYKKPENFRKNLKIEKIFENWTNIEDYLKSNWFEFPQPPERSDFSEIDKRNIHFLLMDNNLVTQRNLFKKLLFNRNVPLVIGNNANEVDIYPSPNSVRYWDMEFLKDYMKMNMRHFSNSKNPINHSTQGFNYQDFLKYFSNESTMTAEDIYTQTVTDIRITCPLNSLLKKLISVSSAQLIYRYILEDRHKNSDYFNVKYSNGFAAHGWDQIIYFHGYKTLPDYGVYGQKEQLMSDILNKVMYDFAWHDMITHMSVSKDGYVSMNLIKSGEILRKCSFKTNECSYWESQLGGEIERFMWFV